MGKERVAANGTAGAGAEWRVRPTVSPPAAELLHAGTLTKESWLWGPSSLDPVSELDLTNWTFQSGLKRSRKTIHWNFTFCYPSVVSEVAFTSYHTWLLLPPHFLLRFQCCHLLVASILNRRIRIKNKCLRVAKAALGAVGGEAPQWQSGPVQIHAPRSPLSQPRWDNSCVQIRQK